MPAANLLTIEPDFGHFPNRDECRLVQLDAGTRLVRIYNQAEAEAISSVGTPNYDRLDFNPVVMDDDATVMQRGRFSGSKSLRSNPAYADDIATLYLASYVDPTDPAEPAKYDESITVWEVLDHHNIQEGALASYYSPVMFPVGLSFCYFELTRPLTILELTNARDLEPVGALFPGGPFGNDHIVSRKWGRFLRSRFPDVDGFAYTSTKFGALDSRSAFVLFERPPHVTAANATSLGRPVRALGDSFSLLTSEGIGLLQKALSNRFMP